MDDSETAPRRFEQIHLSTALVLVGVGGALLFPLVNYVRPVLREGLAAEPGSNLLVVFGIVFVMCAGLLVLLYYVAEACEYLIERRKNRATDEIPPQTDCK